MNRDKKIFLGLAVLTLLIYGQSIWGGFVFDDRGILEHRETLSHLANLKEVALHPYWDIDAGLYRPTTLLSYAFNVIFLGGSAASFHLVNLLLYFLICASVYLLLKRLFKDEWLALFSALLFLVLPIHTEVVANITGRSELLALLFSLLVMLEFSHEKVNFWRAGLWMLIAIGAKETAVATLPLVLLTLIIREGRISFDLAKKYFTGLSAVAIAALVYFVLRFFVLGPAHFLGIQTSLIENPLLFAHASDRVVTALSILWMYVSKSLWPVNLCSDYSYNQIPVMSGFLHIGTLLGLSVIAASAAAVFYLKRRPVVSFGAAAFFFSFLPVSNLIFPIGTVAGERLFFFPSLGLVIIAVFLFSKLKMRTLVMAAILVVYCILAFNRQAVWLSEERLFLNAAHCAPDSVLSRSNSGAAYLFMGDLGKAAQELEISRNIKPIYSKGLNNLGLVYWKMGRNREAESLYFESLRQEYPYGGALENLVLLYLSEKDYAKALRWLRIAYPNADDSFLRSLF